jgi:hypothetical protein
MTYETLSKAASHERISQLVCILDERLGIEALPADIAALSPDNMDATKEYLPTKTKGSAVPCQEIPSPIHEAREEGNRECIKRDIRWTKFQMTRKLKWANWHRSLRFLKFLNFQEL